MSLSETGVLDHHDMGTYTLREADGTVVAQVPTQFVDDLMDAHKLTRDSKDNSKYVLAP